MGGWTGDGCTVLYVFALSYPFRVHPLVNSQFNATIRSLLIQYRVVLSSVVLFCKEARVLGRRLPVSKSKLSQLLLKPPLIQFNTSKTTGEPKNSTRVSPLGRFTDSLAEGNEWSMTPPVSYSTLTTTVIHFNGYGKANWSGTDVEEHDGHVNDSDTPRPEI